MNDVRSPWTHASRRVKITTTGVAVLVVAGVVAGPAAFGDNATPPVKVPAAEVHKPSAIPDRILLTPTTTPATSQKVTWRAKAEAPYAQAQFMEAPRALGDVAPAAGAVTSVQAEATNSVNTSLGYASTYHTAQFTGLKPATRYTYRVGDGTNWSPWTDFTTAAAELKPFSFIYYGDAQNYIDSAVPRVFRKAFADRPEAKVVVNAGDLIDTANSEEQWGQWYQAGSFIDAQVNSISVPGNHEYSNGLSNFWRPQFPYPDNGPGDAALKQTAYTVDYQGVRFIALDSNVQSDAKLMAAQTAWLEGLLKNNPNKWTAVTFHHPVYSTTGSRNNAAVRDQWGPLFEKYGVDLVLQGHDHSYGRGNKTENRKSVTTHNGVTYVVSVSGGKMYALNNGANWTGNGAEPVANSERTQLYQLIDVEKDQLRFEARYANGEHFDGFTVRKNAKGEKTVNEIRTPENSVGEHVTVDKTKVSNRLGTVDVSAFGYDPGESATVSMRRTDGKKVILQLPIGVAKADELGRLRHTARLNPLTMPKGTYVIHLESKNQKITSPVITVTN
ncbi:purple acid phosphatase family protein [Streptomyces paludis]|uniref:purple acid phosphatase family protein n=1 Tax=Streptomyces paludis TaxID=2282738 RepID=UPI001E650026|nr:metallophosphoesterase family protein [Streptomyces paludis]